jgi:hypothetical protein
VRGPKHFVKTGKTPVLEADAWRKLLKSIPLRRCATGIDRDVDLLVCAHYRVAQDEG